MGVVEEKKEPETVVEVKKENEPTEEELLLREIKKSEKDQQKISMIQGAWKAKKVKRQLEADKKEKSLDKSQEKSRVEEKALVEEVKVEEKALVEEVKTEEKALVEELKVEEKAPVEEVKVEEKALVEEVKVEEKALVVDEKKEAEPTEEELLLREINKSDKD